MYSMLVACNCNDLRAVRVAMAVTAQIMPAMDHRAVSSWRKIPQINGGWFYYRPDPPPARSLVTEHVNETYEVLAFGEILSEPSAARRILTEWQKGGPRGVRALDGSFSAVIVDRTQGTVHVVSDTIGRRALRYAVAGNRLFISTHDVPIIATGACPIDYDLISAASIVALDWSLGGRSLLKAIRPCDPHKLLRWDGCLQETDDEPIDLGGRLEQRDRAGCAALRDEMLEIVTQRAHDLTTRSDSVRAALTAGLDSRAVFAALHAVAKDRLQLYTRGEPGNADVRVARRIAAKYGVPHESAAPEVPAVKAFLENCQVQAFFHNGDVSANRCFGRSHVYSPSGPVAIGGGAGEWYRGFYYPLSLAKVSNQHHALAVLRSRLRRIRALPWRGPDLMDGVESRLAETLDKLAGITRDGNDILDLFYVFERWRCWGVGARTPHSERSHALFESAPLLRKAFQMPSPVGWRCRLHEALIQRFLPGVYWWPINGRSILPLDTVPGVSRLLRAAARIKRSPRRGRRSILQIGADMLATMLQGELRDQLVYRDSFGQEVLGATGLEQLIEEHATGKANHLLPLSFLITLEQWKGQIQRAHAAAAGYVTERGDRDGAVGSGESSSVSARQS